MAFKPAYFGFIGLLAVCLADGAAAANIYRYKDESGRTVFNTRIPPEYVAGGYTVLDERGRVVQEVAPAPTAEELAGVEAERERQRQLEADLEKQRVADRLLLRLYRSPDEVARRRDEQLEQIAAQQAALRASLAKVNEEHQRLLGMLAANDEAGRETPEPARSQLGAVEEEKSRLENQVRRLQEDADQIAAGAARDMARLEELLGGR